MGKLSLDQLLHTIDYVHEYSCDSNSISFEEQTLNLQVESSRPIEKSNIEENLQDDLDSTSIKTPSTKETNFGVSRFEVPANAVTRKRSRRVCCETKMNRNKNSGTINIKSENETLESINKEGMKIEGLQKEQPNKRGRGRPPKERKTQNIVDEEVVRESFTSGQSVRKQSSPTKVRRIMNDKTSPEGYREGNNEFLAAANMGSCINLTNDDDKSNEKASALEMEIQNIVSEEVVRESYISRKYARKQSSPTKVTRIMNDKTSPKGYQEGNNEFLAAANKGSCISLTDDDDKSDEKKSALEMEIQNIVDEEVARESCTWRKSGRKQSSPTKVRRIMNDKTSPQGYHEGNNEFLAVAKKGSCINLSDDDDKSNEKQSEVEMETPEPLKVVLNSDCTTAQIGNELQLNKEIQEDFSVRSASHSEDCHINVESQVVGHLDSASIKWPFVKSSPLWETIKSSELFSSMPQQPHFFPLKQYSKSRREGIAIGLMVQFSTIVNNVLKFCVSDADEMIETLNDLERHGFKLYNLRNLLEYFRTLNKSKKRIMNEVHATNGLNSDGQSNEDLSNKKLEATDKTIVELEQPMIELNHINKCLEEEKSMKFKEVEGFDGKTNELQNDGKSIENSYPEAESSLQSARRKFVIDLNEAIENISLDDTISTDDKKEESEVERVCENNLSICEKGSNKIERALTFEQVSKYFYMPISQASKELNMGLTALKKKCRELGIPRWPHRKMKSLETLIRNAQETGREEGVVVEKLDIERLEQEKKLMEREPSIKMEEKTKRLRQAFFKANYKKRRMQTESVPEAAAADQPDIKPIN